MRWLFACCLSLGFYLAAEVRAADSPVGPLRTAADVLGLTAELAGRRLPIEVTGVVTTAEADWNGQFFLQDATGGVFVENLSERRPAVGDRVTVWGVSHPGAFAPIISSPVWRVDGVAPLPEARTVLVEDLETGVHDGSRVEVTGVVRSAQVLGGRLLAYLAIGGYRLQIYLPATAVADPRSLIAATIRVRGTAATHYNKTLRHLIGVGVYVPTVEDFLIVAPETADPFGAAIVPLGRVAQYRRGAGAATRVHVRGRVTFQRVGRSVFIEDASGGLRIDSEDTTRFKPGEELEASGFLEYEAHLPLLRDSTLRRVDGPATAVVAHRVAPADLRSGLHHGSLVTLRGRVLDRITRPEIRDESGFAGQITTWVIQGDGIGFTAEYETAGDAADPRAAPIGSLVDVDGVCFSTVDAVARLQTLRLLVPTLERIRVVTRPSWLTPGRLLAGLGVLSGLLVFAVVWSWTMARKNEALRVLIGEREEAQRQLQEAHDTLEQKVVERSAQLRVEMTARKAAELQFKAVLAERTRLARDLHDTLEQAMTGIALQLEATAKLAPELTAKPLHHLKLARGWLQQSQEQLRHSIWDLRSRELEQFDLALALRQSAERLVDGTEVRLTFQVHGAKQPLPEVVEENLLRIGQEAMTNIAKHARARTMDVTLDFGVERLTLTVEDDGVGFDRSAGRGVENRFGLMGMQERARRMGGECTIGSEVGRGTTLRVEIPRASLEAARALVELEAKETIV